MASWVKRAMAAIAALALPAAPAAAQVPDPYARELAQKLARAQTVVSDMGYQRAAGPFAGGLASSRDARFQVMLRAGIDYRVVGVCDSRCADLDMRLYDANDGRIAEDVLEDAVPVIHIRPVFTGQYTIEVTMIRCASEPCWFAFNVYSR